MDELIDLVRAWSVRARIQQGLRWMFAGLTAGLLVALVPALVARAFPLVSAPALLLLGIACGAAGLLMALLWPWLSSRRSLAGWARQFDQQFEAAERMSTAIELQAGAIATPNDDLRQLQQADALSVAQRVDVSATLPLGVSWKQAGLALAAFVALLLAILLPNPQEQVLADLAKARQVMAEQSQSLDEAKKTIAQSALSDDQKQQALQAIDQAQQQLADPNTTPEKALAALNDAQAKIDALRDQAWQQRRDELQRAGQSLQPDELTNRLADALTAGDVEQAARQMRDLTNTSDGQPQTEGQRQRLANQLDQLARGMQPSDPLSAQRLREAAQHLRENDTQAVREQLDQVAETLDQDQPAESASRSIDKTQSQVDAARRAIAQTASQEQPASQSGQSAQPSADPGAQRSTNRSNEPAAQGNTQSGAAQSGQAGDDVQAGSGEADGAQAGQVAAGHHEDTGSDNSIYAPSPRLNADGSPVVLPGNEGKSAPDPSGGTSPGLAAKALVPYQQVYREYAQAADEAIQSGSVPPQLRTYVRDYFSSLDPQQR